MVVVRLLGGLGNQMFQYAFGRALAIKTATALKLDLTFLLERTPRKGFAFRNFDLNALNIRAQVAQQSDIPLLRRRLLSGRTGLWLDAISRRILPGRLSERHFYFCHPPAVKTRSLYANGYWQSPKYFEDIRPIIRRDFTLKVPLSGIDESLKARIRNADSICVHVRRGDFISSKTHCLLGPEYYESAVAYVRTRIATPQVFVFSNDLQWCRANLDFGVDTEFVESQQIPAHQLDVMAACRSFVIPNSTFSWWAAWLNSDPNKVVVAPKRWFVDQSIRTDDLFPAQWVRI